MAGMKCLICFQKISEAMYLSNYFSRPPIICAECEGSFEKLTGRRCPHCRRQLGEDEVTCTDCTYMHQHVQPLDRIHILYHYNHFMKELIHCYKGRGDIKLAEVFAYKLLQEKALLKKFDAIIPLPTSQDKLMTRGFSQIEKIMDISGLSYNQVLTMQPRPKQSELTRKERLQQSNPFEVISPVAGHILLIDDIYTTGLTVHRAAEVLRREKVVTIEVLAFARP
ncbi:ComF family protein [Macrococcus hajekii]|uniref:ComF family protein n=1 Tax=Macrococcus hajekii TaxID=198482 RepID=A0A4R6BIK3_9STAP|nr:ComF family protein [Macrococcus hajekii]TDM01473.1 ComF family protein [Macrococcus hajekii]GGB00265.1 competence protein ComF [Macrococcus hajekii]